LIARGLCFANDACQLWQADTEEDLCLAGGPHMTPRWPLKQYQIDFSGGLDFTESGRWLPTANPWCYVTCFVAFTLIDGRMAMQCEASDWDQLTTCAALRRFCTPMMISLFGRIDRCVNPRAMHFHASASPFEALLVDPTSRRWWHERRSEATAWSPNAHCWGPLVRSVRQPAGRGDGQPAILLIDAAESSSPRHRAPTIPKPILPQNYLRGLSLWRHLWLHGIFSDTARADHDLRHEGRYCS
jgi:hypothetical protein